LPILRLEVDPPKNQKQQMVEERIRLMAIDKPTNRCSDHPRPTTFTKAAPPVAGVIASLRSLFVVPD